MLCDNYIHFLYLSLPKYAKSHKQCDIIPFNIVSPCVIVIHFYVIVLHFLILIMVILIIQTLIINNTI